MKPTASASIEELRSSLCAVVDACPVDKCNPVDCPLFQLRKMSHRKRLLWFNALNEAELRYLACYHQVCMGLKLNGRLSPQSQLEIRRNEHAR